MATLTANPSNTLKIKIQRVKKAYFAKKEIISTEKSGETYSYTFKGSNNTSTTARKEKIAGIIFKNITPKLKNNKQQTTAKQVVSALTKKAYKKGDCIDIPLVKEKIKFIKQPSANLGDKLYVVVETENMPDRKIKMNFKQGGDKKVLADKETAIFVTQENNNQASYLFTATVGEFAKQDTVINASDFKNFAITKIALQSSAEETNKKYKEALNKAEGKKAPFYIAMDAEPEENNWASVKYEEVFDNRPNLWYYGDGNWFELKAKQSENSQYYIYKTGKIKLVKGVNSKNDYYVESETDKFELLYTLEKNTYGMVKIPDSGDGFGRYGTNDAGGNSGTEVVGSGDRYVLPKTAAALFGIINEVDDKGWEIHLGDMSSDNGSDPWQSGFSHHAGHGHNGTRKGLDVDFRYLNSLGKSFQGNNDSSIFDSDKNKTIFELAHKYGFKKNYCTNVATVFGESISGVSNVSEHKDHGHIGLSDIDLEEVESVNVTII